MTNLNECPNLDYELDNDNFAEGFMAQGREQLEADYQAWLAQQQSEQSVDDTAQEASVNVNHYVLDRIEEGAFETTWGHLNGHSFEVFEVLDSDTDEALVAGGLARCDALNWSRTMLVEEAFVKLAVKRDT